MKQKKRSFLILRVLISVILLSYLFRLLDLKRLATLFSIVDERIVVLAPFLILGGLMASSFRWKFLLKGLNTCQSFARLYGYYLIGFFYSIFLPGVIGGDIIRIGMCSSETNKSVSLITASVLIERTCGIIILFIAASLFVFMLPPKLIHDLGHLVIITLPLTTAIMIILIISAFLLHRKYRSVLDHKIQKNRFISRMIQLVNLIMDMPAYIIVTTVVFTTLFQASDILATFAISTSLHINVSLPLFFTIMPIVYIMTILPISLGGLGVREGTFVYLLNKIGVLPSDAIALAFLIYANRIIIAFAGGAVQLLWKKNRPPNQLVSIKE